MAIRGRALRSDRAPSVGNAFWPRRRVPMLVTGHWLCGYFATRSSVADAEQGLKDAREVGQAHSILFAGHKGPVVWPAKSL